MLTELKWTPRALVSCAASAATGSAALACAAPVVSAVTMTNAAAVAINRLIVVCHPVGCDVPVTLSYPDRVIKRTLRNRFH
ncbi:hypothetical protein Hesp01_31410 [Herbidospora sp. NBRC 101105]|nr:hypothetical protein Hesp01_31410 [Herbidospora sp. NBRC 101105]